MTLRQEIHACIDGISERKLMALKPLLVALADESVVIEHDLTDEERSSIAQGMKDFEVNPQSFIPLSRL